MYMGSKHQYWWHVVWDISSAVNQSIPLTLTAHCFYIRLHLTSHGVRIRHYPN